MPFGGINVDYRDDFDGDRDDRRHHDRGRGRGHGHDRDRDDHGDVHLRVNEEVTTEVPKVQASIDQVDQG